LHLQHRPPRTAAVWATLWVNVAEFGSGVICEAG
jgi:hypothetical protein